MTKQEVSGFAESFGNGERDESFAASAGAFHQAVGSSERFSWMGVFETKDELQRPRVVIYLKEKSRASDVNHKTDILPAFRRLWSACQPYVFLDLYFDLSDDIDQLAAKSVEDIELRYGTDTYKPKATLLWEEQFVGEV